MSGNWERRWHPLREEWVLIASTSASRPWSGAIARGHSQHVPAHDPSCYLCPRVTRANNTANPDYRGVYVFDNDFPSLSMDAPAVHRDDDVLASVAPAHGRCRVLCWSERHDATLASLTTEQIKAAARCWQEEYTTLSQDPRIEHVLIFENKGTEIGVSNLHPHGQIYALNFVSDTAMRMRRAQARYATERPGQSLLQDMLARAELGKSQVIERHTHWSVIVPFAARFAFET